MERVRQRDEAPFCGRQMEEVENDNTERDEIWQNAQQQRQPLEKQLPAFEAQIETRKHRQRGRQGVMRCDQKVARGQICETHRFAGRLKNKDWITSLQSR